MLRCALIACDEQGQVQWMNHSAMLLTSAERGLSSRGGLLRAQGQGLSTRLHEDIATAARDEARAVHYTVIDNGHCPLHIALRASSVDALGARSVMLAITSAQDLVNVPPDIWAKLLGLTLAEARLVAALAQGETVELHATQRGIALGTARNQLKMALAKTGTSRQADLVRVALSSAAAQVLG
jgi:DNA-binding CsgD family transcriptional regulator